MPDTRGLQRKALAVTRFVGSPLSIVTHTILFVGSFCAVVFGLLQFDRMLLILTTVVSLEAIYLAIFIQMTINYQAKSLAEVRENVGEIQEDVGEIQEDVEEMSEDVEELQEDIEEIGEGVEEIGMEEESEEVAEDQRKQEQKETLDSIELTLQKLIADIEHLKSTRKEGATLPLP